MSEVVSLESKLTTHWEEVLDTGTKMTENAQRNLGRIASIYGGQLSFDSYLEDKLGSE